MIHKKLSLILIGTLLLCLAVPLVKADSVCSIVNYNGSWTSTTPNQISAGNSGNLSEVEYSYNITNANTTLDNCLTFTQYTVQSGSIIPNVSKESKYFYERIGIQTDQGITWLSAVEIQAWYDWWGAYSGRDVMFYMNNSGPVVHNPDLYSDQNFNVTLQAVANYTTDIVTVTASVYNYMVGSVGVTEIPFGGIYAYTQNFTLPAGSTPQDFLVYYGHQGKGNFNANINGYVPSGTQLSGGNGPINPLKSYGILSDIYGFFTTLWAVVVGAITFLFAMIAAFWPIFPFLAICYLLDLFYSSYESGGFRAIGDTALQLWNVIIETTSTVVTAIQAIGEFAYSGVAWLLALFGIVI